MDEFPTSPIAGVTDKSMELTDLTVDLIRSGQLAPNANEIHALARELQQARKALKGRKMKRLNVFAIVVLLIGTLDFYAIHYVKTTAPCVTKETHAVKGQTYNATQSPTDAAVSDVILKNITIVPGPHPAFDIVKAPTYQPAITPTCPDGWQLEIQYEPDTKWETAGFIVMQKPNAKDLRCKQVQ